MSTSVPNNSESDIALSYCGCTPSEVETKRISANLPWHGFEPYTYQPNTYPLTVKYLQQVATHSPETPCQSGPLSTTENIDPFTGMISRTGSEPSNRLTKIFWGPLWGSALKTPSSWSLPWGVAPLCAGAPWRDGLLSGQLNLPYTIQDVKEAVEQLISIASFSDIPLYNAHATIIPGSNGQIALKWNAYDENASISAGVWNHGGSVEASKVYVRFLKKTKLAFYFYPQGGGNRVKVGGDIEYNPGDELILSPPEQGFGVNIAEIISPGCKELCVIPTTITPTNPQGWTSSEERSMGNFHGYTHNCKLYRQIRTEESIDGGSDSRRSRGGEEAFISTSSSNFGFSKKSLWRDGGLTQGTFGSAGSRSEYRDFPWTAPDGVVWPGRTIKSSSSSSIIDSVNSIMGTQSSFSDSLGSSRESYYEDFFNIGTGVGVDFGCHCAEGSVPVSGDGFSRRCEIKNSGYESENRSWSSTVGVNGGISINDSHDSVSRYLIEYSDESINGLMAPAFHTVHPPDEYGGAKLTTASSFGIFMGSLYMAMRGENCLVNFEVEATIPKLKACARPDFSPNTFITFVHWVVQKDDESSSTPSREVIAYNYQVEHTTVPGDTFNIYSGASQFLQDPIFILPDFTLTEFSYGGGTSSAIIHYTAATVIKK